GVLRAGLVLAAEAGGRAPARSRFRSSAIAALAQLDDRRLLLRWFRLRHQRDFHRRHTRSTAAALRARRLDLAPGRCRRDTLCIYLGSRRRNARPDPGLVVRLCSANGFYRTASLHRE